MNHLFIIKKGKGVETGNPKVVLHLAKKIKAMLKSFSKRIEVVGSIRRKKPNPTDIDIVVIPKSNIDKEKIERELKKHGKKIVAGNKQLKYKIHGIKVEIYFSDEKSWGAMLLAYTGPSGSQIGLRTIAKKQGMLLNQYGLYQHNRHIAGKTEESIYKALNKQYKVPSKR